MSWQNILGLFFAFSLFLAIIYQTLKFIFSSIFTIYYHKTEKWRIERKLHNSRDLKGKYESFLTKNSPYYCSLNARSKTKFLMRLRDLLREKEFVGKNGFMITEEVRILISASIIQLTFGFDHYGFNYFNTFYIYPDVYYNRMLDQYHRGETNPKGIVVLSWKHFETGFHDYTDKINLGLHEMAHALDLSRRVNDVDDFFEHYFKKWYSVSNSEFLMMQKRPSFLRPYASENFKEFFAVCVEHFFEAPAEFKKELPDIYTHLSILLKQDPLITSDYVSTVETQNSNEIQEFELSKGPLFINRSNHPSSFFSLIRTFFNVSIFTIVFILTIYHEVYTFSIALLVIIFIVYAVKSTQFELYSNHLVLKNPLWFNKINSFSYQNIISIDFLVKGENKIEIIYVDKDQIRTFTALADFDNNDWPEIENILIDKNIQMRWPPFSLFRYA